MQGGCDAVGYHDEHKPIPGGRYAAVEDEVAKPVPEDHLARDFEVAVPPSWTFGGGLPEEKVLPGANVKVETPKEENGVVQPMLMRNRKARKGIEMHYLIVVSRSQ